jgi:hydrogenase nickel incorporation protein HypB
MTEARIIEIKEEILSDNNAVADDLRSELRRKGVFLLNLMSSPGSGKTSLILNTIRQLKDRFRIGVIEGDIDSTVDADKVIMEGVQAVQLKTGGFCHLDASMVMMALREFDLSRTDIMIIENIGNLVCPAEFDTGAEKSAMILSIPEGDDKPLKYPLMFSVCDVIVINKMDYLPFSDFNMEAFRERVGILNPRADIIELSCRTGAGMDGWVKWLSDQVTAIRK